MFTSFFHVPARSDGALLAQIVAAILLSALVIFLVHRLLSTRGKRWLIVAITFLAGLYYTFE